MKKLVIISIGIPGSGKTTLLRPLAERFGLVRISRDDIRAELLGHPLDRSNQERMHMEAERRMRTSLSKGKSIVLDSTFTEKLKRQNVVRIAREAGAERVIGIVFETPLEIAKERNRTREHVVYDEVIERKHAELTINPPSLEEDFDVLYSSEDLDKLETELSEGV